jgi:hypothetical protein
MDRSIPTVWVSLLACTTLFAQQTSTPTSAATKDPQAVAIVQGTVAAMGGVQALLQYQDSLCSGTITLKFGSNLATYPITFKSKGLQQTRVETQLPKGTLIRIANQGQGVIVRPDGSIKALWANNTISERVNHLPLFSILAEYSNDNISLSYKGVAAIQGQSDDMVEVEILSNNQDPIQTVFFINQSNGLVDKIQSISFNEGDSKAAVNEELYLSDYRLVSGIQVPFIQILFVDGKAHSQVDLTSAAFNVGLLDSEFALPKGGVQ